MLVTEVKIMQGLVGTAVQVFDESELVASFLLKAPADEAKPTLSVSPTPKPEVPSIPTIDITEHDSPNQSTRAATINAIVLHNTAGEFMPSIEWLCNPDAQASAHLVISREGKTACLVDFSRKAWHAGSREWNNCSIGIEIEAYDEAEGMTPEQEQKVVSWCRWMMKRYNIKADRIRTHRSVLNGGTDCPVLIWPTEANFLTWRKKWFDV
jgi:N-acetyl-anhydromuramyl-L-alanine amidase AmpD